MNTFARSIVGILSILFWAGCDSSSKSSYTKFGEHEKGKVSLGGTNKQNLLAADSTLFLNAFKNKGDIQCDGITINKDTLKVITTGWYFYYPFGKFKDSTALRGAFNRLDFKPDTYENEQLYKVSNELTSIKFIYQPTTKKMEITSGKIADNSVILKNGIYVGMKKTKFFETYFNSVEGDAIKKINVVEFITALDGMWHYYNFERDNLSSIVFKTDYQIPQ